MSLSTHATTILSALQHNPDPLSRAELADTYHMTQTEVVKAINELSGIYEIERLMSGFRLSNKDELPDLKEATPSEKILALLCFSVTRTYPRTISKRLNLPLRTVQSTLATLLNDKIISHRVPGTYYLTRNAAAYLANYYPHLNISAVTQGRIPIEDDTDNYTFTISRSTAKRKATDPVPASTPLTQATLTGIGEKILLLKELKDKAAATPAQHLTDLIIFLELHTEH